MILRSSERVIVAIHSIFLRCACALRSRLHSRHRRPPRRLMYVLASSYRCPLGQCVLAAFNVPTLSPMSSPSAILCHARHDLAPLFVTYTLSSVSPEPRSPWVLTLATSDLPARPTTRRVLSP